MKHSYVTQGSAQPLLQRTALAGVLVAVFALMLAGCTSTDAVTATQTTENEKPVVQVEELGEGDQTANFDLLVTGPVQVNFRKITIPPGQGTGEHCHHGNLIAVVEQGTLTHYASIYPSGVHEYSAGDSIFEGSDYRHEGKNEGDEDVVLLVTYLTPEGEPLAETDLDRCDPEG